MPYIDPLERDHLDPLIASIAPHIATPGQLAYVIYRLVLPRVSYKSLSAGRAVLKDLYDILTKMLLDYEDIKRVQNGDIR